MMGETKRCWVSQTFPDVFLPAIKHGGCFSYFPKQTNVLIQQQECFTHVVLTHFPEFIEYVTFNAKTFIISFNISTSN